MSLACFPSVSRTAGALCLALLALPIASQKAATEQPPYDVRQRAGIDTGLALVLGGDLELPVQLASDGRMLVHWLLADAKRIDAARKEVMDRGFGGRIVVNAIPANGRLPHPDRFVNLVVADLDALGPRAPSREEIVRVLAIRGAACLKQQGNWEVEKAPPNDRLDDWTHRWYDASGNCVSRDRIAGFPHAVQWQHGPAMEDGTADGRIMHVADGYVVAVDASSGNLVCRDSGNGALLWRAPTRLKVNEEFAIAGGEIYLYHSPEVERVDIDRAARMSRSLMAFDLRTGKSLRVYNAAAKRGTVQPIEYEYLGRRRKVVPEPWFVVSENVIVQAYGRELIILERISGKRRWSKRLEGATWFSPIVAGELVLAAEAAMPARLGRHDGSGYVRAVVAFALKDGARRWCNEAIHPEREIEDRKEGRYIARAEFKPMSAADGLVLLHTSSYQFRQGGSVAVLDAQTGHELWRRSFEPKALYTQGSQRAVLRAGEVVLLDGTGAFRWNARTGDPIGEPLKPARTIKRGARTNGACTASRATVDWLICNGYLYVGPDGKPQTCFGARGACGQGVIPAMGLVFVLPTACDCGDYTRGYQALAPTVPGTLVPNDHRLTRTGKPPTRHKQDEAWPVFLGDAMRRSMRGSDPLGELAERWRVRVAPAPRGDWIETDRRVSERFLGALSAPVVGGRRVVVAASERHEIAAFDADSGKVAWRFAAGGKVDSPPTLARGMAIFGCDDGTVYALRLSDGEPVWRFVAAPTNGVAMHHGHLASAFPLPGSVLVLGKRVIAVAGHHTDIGGLHCWSLDLETGEPNAHRIIRRDQPAVTANGLTVADADGRGFWIGNQLHLSADLEDLPVSADRPPPVFFDRNGSRMRFRTNDGRGGSTHGWKGATRIGGKGRMLNAHRMVHAGETAYGLNDPSTRRGGRTAPILWSVRIADGNNALWQRTATELNDKESYGALLLAGEKLYVGGGARDGSAGFVQVVDARSGRLLREHPLPARVTECGLATAYGRLYISLENGELLCLNGG